MKTKNCSTYRVIEVAPRALNQSPIKWQGAEKQCGNKIVIVTRCLFRFDKITSVNPTLHPNKILQSHRKTSGPIGYDEVPKRYIRKWGEKVFQHCGADFLASGKAKPVKWINSHNHHKNIQT